MVASRCERRRRGLRAAAAAIALFAAGPVRAGEVPSTALAQSLRIDPLLLDSPALVFQFPQLVASRDSTALAFGRTSARSEAFVATNGQEYGLGTTLCASAVGGFVYSQLPFSTTPLVSSNVLQVGGGARWGAFRLGAALRGTRDRSELAVEQSVEMRAERAVRDILEGAVGAGLVWRDATFDAVFEWGWAGLQSASLYETPNDTLVVKLEGEAEGQAGVVTRISTPIGSRLRVVGAGEYRWGDVAWTGQVFHRQVLRPADHADGSKLWSAGLAFLFAAPHLDVAAVSCTFEHREWTLTDVDYYSGLSTTQTGRDFGALTFSAQRRLWRTLSAQAGWTTTYVRDRNDRDQNGTNGTIFTASRGETIRDGFSWGLTYTWRTLELASSLHAPPRLDTPIETIDVYVRF